MNMDKETRLKVAAQLVRIAKAISADEMESFDEEEEIDPNFIAKVRALRQVLPRLAQKKRRKLRQFGITMIRGNNSVEDLVNALMAVANA